MQWKQYLLVERQNHFFKRIAAWVIRGGEIQLYNLAIPNARLATNHFIEAKFILGLKEALIRKEQRNEDFNKALREIKKKQDGMTKDSMESLIEKMALKLNVI